MAITVKKLKTIPPKQACSTHYLVCVNLQIKIKVRRSVTKVLFMYTILTILILHQKQIYC